jgi:flagellar biosynthetic protein FliR
MQLAADPPLAAGVIVRMAAAVAVGCLPLLPLVPVRIRAALAVGLAIAALPAAASARGQALSAEPLPLLLVGEACVGLGLGLVASAVLAAAGWAGGILGSVAGLSWAEDFGPEDGGDTEGVGRLAWWLGLAAFFGAGGHLAVVAGLVDSVRALPVGTAFVTNLAAQAATHGVPGGPLAAIVTTLPALGLSLALALAGPALAAVVAFHVTAAICLRTIRFAPGQGMLQAASALVLIGGLVVGMVVGAIINAAMMSQQNGF